MELNDRKYNVNQYKYYIQNLIIYANYRKFGQIVIVSMYIYNTVYNWAGNLNIMLNIADT